jgi:hypothetical protein
LGAQQLSLKILPIDLSGRSTTIGIMTLKNRTLNPLAKLFIDCARDVTKSFAATSLMTGYKRTSRRWNLKSAHSKGSLSRNATPPRSRAPR